MASPRAGLGLEARAIRVRFGELAALDGVDLVLDGAQPVAILGPNGAGKSVLLRTLHGLIAPDEGEIRWAGSTERPRDQAMVFQRAVMLRRSALANIEYALAVNGIEGTERRDRAHEALARARLSHLASRPARALSGGEQQRVALARAWALRPRVVFLDEPTASLDPGAAAEVERLMAEMRAAGTAIVFTTHHLGLARRASSDIVFLDHGRVVERTPADSFFTAPRSKQAAEYLQGELP
ncbi:MAG TPA: ATP-binding cassette domain-containing protein [Usitatibacter sp.]|jgi:tungstate transport system ATP-binding protein|nr:ATP-binding cassette domain-containing protein [Usitatibacter sp.]